MLKKANIQKNSIQSVLKQPIPDQMEEIKSNAPNKKTQVIMIEGFDMVAGDVKDFECASKEQAALICADYLNDSTQVAAYSESRKRIWIKDMTKVNRPNVNPDVSLFYFGQQQKPEIT